MLHRSALREPKANGLTDLLLVGLEIKCELLVGELSQLRQAILPIVAALGGATFPALLYTIFTWGTPASSETHAGAIQAPLHRIEHALYVPASLGILPLFVLSNASVRLDPIALVHAWLSPVSLGIILGLLVGKQLGIPLFSWVVVKLKWAQLPTGVIWRHI